MSSATSHVSAPNTFLSDPLMAMEANPKSMHVTISVPTTKSREMVTEEIFVWHFGPDAPCKAHYCRLEREEADRVNSVDMVLEFPQDAVAENYLVEIIPKFEALGYTFIRPRL